MSRFGHYILLGVASVSVADAFRLPSSSHAFANHAVGGALRNREDVPTFSQKLGHISNLRLSLSKSGDDAQSQLGEGFEALDTDLAREIEEALSLAQSALIAEAEVSPEAEDEDEDEEIDGIANMLLEKPRATPDAVPLPPIEDPPESVISLILEEEQVADEDAQPAESEPEAPAIDLGEILLKSLGEEMEKLKDIIFGVNEELEETKADTDEVKDTAAVLKKEIEESLKEREALIKEIETEVAAEKELLVAQLGIASEELKNGIDQSERNVNDSKSKAARGEKELISRIDSFKANIDKVIDEVAEITSDKKKKELSKQTMLGQAMQEGKDKLARFQKSFDFDISYAKQINAELASRAEAAEGKVRAVYDQINQMREERVLLQEQIVDVEKNALEEIATLERQLKLDDERYTTALEKERERMENVIDVAYQAYAIKICKKIVERQSAEDDYKEKLRNIDAQIKSARDKKEAQVKEYLDKLEDKHKKERILVYQERFEAIYAVRKQMSAEIDIESAKVEQIHKTMRAKIDTMHEQTAQVKAEFETEMAKKRQLAKEEEGELQSEIDDVRVDMTEQIKTQRRLYEEQKASYLYDMNGQISDSEVELRQRWQELASIKQSCSEVRSERNDTRDDVAEQQALIDSYESDQKSFRKSLRLTAKVAKEKIGSKTRRLLRRDKTKSP